MGKKRPRLTGKEVEKVLMKIDWYLHHSRGSHFYYRHPAYLGIQITVPIHSGEILPQKTLSSILDYASISWEELEELIGGEKNCIHIQ